MKTKDFIALENFLEQFPPAEPQLASLLLEFPFLRGEKDFLIAGLERFPKTQQFTIPFQRLLTIWNFLVDFGLEANIRANLGLIRDFDYYTGVIFEGFSPLSGSPLLAGGRYDELFRIFGKDRPACGFALFVERLVEVYEKSHPENSIPALTYTIHYPSRYRQPVFSLSQKLRKQHLSIITQEHNEPPFAIKVTDGTREHIWTDPDWNTIFEQIQKVIGNG